MNLTLDGTLKIGIQTIHRRTEPATGPWLPAIDELVSFVELVDRSGYDSLWVGDHISFPVPILDPMLQLAQAAVASRRLMLGTSVLLLPLRHPTPEAKQVLTLDHLTEGHDEPTADPLVLDVWVRHEKISSVPDLVPAVVASGPAQSEDVLGDESVEHEHRHDFGPPSVGTGRGSRFRVGQLTSRVLAA